MKKIILFFVSVILFTTTTFSQEKDTTDRNVHLYIITNPNPYPYQPLYVPQDQTELFKSRPKTFGDILFSIQEYFDRERYNNSNYSGYSGYYYGNVYPGVNYSQMNYLMGQNHHFSQSADNEQCNTCFDYSPEIKPYETLVATLKVSELSDTAKINIIQKQYQYFRIGKKVYDVYGVLITGSVPIFARVDDEVVELKKITIPKTKD